MTLKELFSKRRTRYMKEMMKYGRLIFNDHFVLLLFLLVGAGGLAYSDYLDTLTQGMMQPRLLVGVIFYIITSTGSTTLLLEPADQIFLLPKEEDFKEVFKGLVSRSFIESLLSVGLVTILSFPIFVSTIQAQPIDMLFIFFALASLKGLNALFQLMPFFEMNQSQRPKYQAVLSIVKLIALIALLFIHVKVTAILLTIFGFITWTQFSRGNLFLDHLFNWESMIDAEDQRIQKLYRFIGMFATVPNIQTPIKRLAWLDPVLNGLTKRNPNASYYYILRLAIRNTEYSLMILRATSIGVVILAFTNTIILSAVIVLLFLYIIGFQLLTLVNELKKVPLFQIYPISDDEKIKAVQKLIFQFLFIVSILLVLASLNGIGLLGLSLGILGFLFAYLFSYFYAARRIKA